MPEVNGSVQSFFWRRLEDWTGEWEGPPADHELLWAFGQTAYDQLVEWYGPPPDPMSPVTLVGNSKDDPDRYKTYCHYSDRTRRYHIVIHDSEKASYERLSSMAHEMFHRVVMRRGGVQKECWLAETTATIATDDLMIRAGYFVHIDMLRGTAVSMAPKRMALKEVRAYERDGRPYPRPYSIAARCLSLALSSAIPAEELHRLATAPSLDEWLTSLRGDAEYIAHVLLEFPLPRRAHLATGTVGHERLATSLYYKGDWDRALREADIIARVDPRNPAPYALRGRIQLRRKEYGAAIQSLLHAEGPFERGPLICKDLALAYLKIGDHDKAAVYARRAALICPDDPRLHLLLGNAMVGLDDRLAARECWRKAVETGARCAAGAVARRQLWRFPVASDLRVRPRKRFGKFASGEECAIAGR